MRLYVKKTKHANFKKLCLGSSRRHEKTSSLIYVLIVKQRLWYISFFVTGYFIFTSDTWESYVRKLPQTTEQYLWGSYIRLRSDYLSRSSKMMGSEINRRTRGKRWKTVGRNLRPLLFVTLLYGERARATLSYAFVSPWKCSIFP